MSNTNDISQIRQLIFGEEMAKFADRFKTLDDRLAKMDEQVRQIVSQMAADQENNQTVSKNLGNNLEKAMASIENQIKALKDELVSRLETLQDSKAARNDLAKMFTNLATQLKDNTDK